MSRYNGPKNSYDYATGLGVSPDGSRVFVTGPTGYTTVAYDASTGAQEWVGRFWPKGTDNEALALAVSPDSALVFVTGHVYSAQGSSDSDDYGTVAYDAATGTQQWAHGYNGYENYRDGAHAVAVSPDGSVAIVTGVAFERDNFNCTTIAYDAANGETRWHHSFGGVHDSSGAALALSPDGSRVFVTGRTLRPHGSDYATVAYSVS